MSKLDELIAELCPHGVEYVRLGDVLDKIKNIKWSDGVTDKYQYIDLSSVDRELHQIIETQTIDSGNAPSRAQQIVQSGDILFGATRPMLKRYCFVDTVFDGQICSTGFCVLRANTGIVLQKWLYYQITSSDFFEYVLKNQKGASYPMISDSVIKDFKIPLPPIEVQQEIVRILDQFTELTAELTAEMGLRKKQYEYYRNKLLTFDGVDGIEFAKLGEVLGYEQPTKYIVSDTKYDDSYKTPVLTAGQSFVLGHTNETNGVYDATPDNPVIIFDDFTTSFHWVDFDFKVKSSAMKMLRMKNDSTVLFRYVYHFMKTIRYETLEHSRQWISCYSQFDIPIPPLAEQQRIVDILDRFDALCNDLSSGLPAEIAARKKQYEYYRDKLLTFKEVETKTLESKEFGWLQ